jgi:hypothetical protein
MIDAIVSAWVGAIGGVSVIGVLLSLFFVIAIAFVFYKITT